MAYITADQERSYARTAATEALTQVAHRIEGEISRELQVAETLASSAALDQGNLGDFYREATRIVAARPLWETAALTKPDQEQVLNVLRPLGAPLGPVTDTESFNAVLRTRKPVLGGLGPYQAAIGKQLVSLRVPVIRDGELRYILTIGLLPDQIGTILGQAGLPAGWAGTVIDAKEKIVARTPDAKTPRADATTPEVQEAIARGGSNRREPRPGKAWTLKPSIASSAGTEGWSVHVGVPVSELNAPVSRSVAAVVRRNGRERRARDRTRPGDRPRDCPAASHGGAGIGSSAIGQRKARCAGDRCGRTRDVALGHGGKRVQRLQPLLCTCSACRLPSGEASWSADRIIAQIDPSHRAAVTSFGAACLESGKSSSVEFLIQSDDRGEYWLRAAGGPKGHPIEAR